MNLIPHRDGLLSDPVLVVGAGPVGLVFACEMLTQGIPVRVIDRAPESTLHSRAIVVWPRSMELLRRIDAARSLVDAGNRLDGVAFYSDKKLLGSIDMSRMKDTPYPFGLTISQDRTEDVIRRRLLELGGQVEHGVELVGLHNSTENRADRPVATLRHEDGRTEQVHAEYVLGADGARSAVRELLGIPFLGTGADVLFAIGDGPMQGEDLHTNMLLYCYTRTGALGFAPFGDGQFRLAVSVPGWDERQSPPRELFQRMMDERAPRRGVLGELRWTTVFRARRRIAANFRAGRCFLAGDAAHIFSAAGAQGMNTGIQDAANLGWKLGGVIRGVVDERVLGSYDPERRHAAQRVSATTGRQTGWGLLHRRSHIAVRDNMVRLARGTGVLQRLGAPLMSQNDVNYSVNQGVASTPLADFAATLRGQVRVGDRFPVFASRTADGETGDQWPRVRLDRYTVLMWAGDDRDTAWQRRVDQLRTVVAPSVAVVDVSGWPVLAGRLGSRPLAVVVRPDGHVAALDESASPQTVGRALTEVGALVSDPESGVSEAVS
ncbi:FAD-dependent monooxygenase [Pseudonocardia spinosispora]|uniref:FAD-dependent monooxygenase n=1 Tax=Pseudonocardia spinosispora TaxID=103441 RepID=UPI000415B0F3|nr:FAD-dependent monooxygenase [Pseudonocardia spinosispora]